MSSPAVGSSTGLPACARADALRTTIEAVTQRWWPHRFVLREACDLWTAAPQVRDAWLEAVEVATTRIENAIERERERGVAPPALSARTTAQALAWQAERLHFPGRGSATRGDVTG